MIGSIVIVGALTRCVLFHSVCDVKAEQTNVQHGLIWELMLQEYELDHNASEATKTIYCAKSEVVIDHGTLIKKICTSYNKLDGQARSAKILDCAPSQIGKFGELYSEGIRRGRHTTI